MKYGVLRRYLDIMMYLLMSFVAGSGFLIGYRLPPCSRGGDHGITLWGMGRHDWGELHLWAAYALLLMCIVHIAVNYSFIKVIFQKTNRAFPLVVAFAGAAIILYLLIAPTEHQQGGTQCGVPKSTHPAPCSSCPGRASVTPTEHRQDKTPSEGKAFTFPETCAGCPGRTTCDSGQQNLAGE